MHVLCDPSSRVCHVRIYNTTTNMWKHTPHDSAWCRAESMLHSEDMTMKRLKRIVYMCGVVPLLGLALLAQPQSAEARVDVNVGLGVPAPVVVAPTPVVVVRRGHYRYHRGYYHRSSYRYPHRHWRSHHYSPGSYDRYPHRHWRHHHHAWSR